MNGKIQYTVLNGSYIVTFSGDVRLNLCLALDTFIDKMFADKTLVSIAVDLSETETIDSTSLGLLAKIAIRFKKHAQYPPVIISPIEDITRVLTSMGLDRVFTIIATFSHLSRNLQQLQTSEQCSETILKDKIIAAHRTLMALNARNHNTFYDLVSSLEADVPDFLEPENHR